MNAETQRIFRRIAATGQFVGCATQGSAAGAFVALERGGSIRRAMRVPAPPGSTSGLCRAWRSRRPAGPRPGPRAGISAAGCLALWPSVSGFGAGPDHTTSCIAVVNGWSAGRSGPSEAEVNAALRSAPAQPTAAQRLDPDFMANFRAQMQILQASPVL